MDLFLPFRLYCISFTVWLIFCILLTGKSTVLSFMMNHHSYSTVKNRPLDTHYNSFSYFMSFSISSVLSFLRRVLAKSLRNQKQLSILMIMKFFIFCSVQGKKQTSGSYIKSMVFVVVVLGLPKCSTKT